MRTATRLPARTAPGIRSCSVTHWCTLQTLHPSRALIGVAHSLTWKVLEGLGAAPPVPLHSVRHSRRQCASGLRWGWGFSPCSSLHTGRRSRREADAQGMSPPGVCGGKQRGASVKHVVENAKVYGDITLCTYNVASFKPSCWM